jgi:methionyl-tRNA formyltransferase
MERARAAGHSVLGIVGPREGLDGSLLEHAAERDIPVHTPAGINDPRFVERVRALAPDLNVSLFYPHIFGELLLSIPLRGSINVHPGLLPHYRGCNPIEWAIMHDEKEVGVTIHFMDASIDTGDIILQQAFPVAWGDTYGVVVERMAQLLPGTLAEAIASIAEDRVQPHKQHPSQGACFPRLRAEDRWIDWQDTSLDIYNKIRAFAHPNPGCLTLLGGKRLIVWRASYDPAWPASDETPGRVMGTISGQGMLVKTGDSAICIEQVQICM